METTTSVASKGIIVCDFLSRSAGGAFCCCAVLGREGIAVLGEEVGRALGAIWKSGWSSTSGPRSRPGACNVCNFCDVRDVCNVCNVCNVRDLKYVNNVK